jgi:hypothetical protein
MIGPVTYAPSGRFSLTRSYPWRVGINVGTDTSDNPSPGVYRWFASVAVPPVIVTFKLFDNFVPWSTTGFTLDHVLEECYYSFFPYTHNDPASVCVSVEPDPSDGHLMIRLASSCYVLTPAVYTLPGAPGDYWMQPGFP